MKCSNKKSACTKQAVEISINNREINFTRHNTASSCCLNNKINEEINKNIEFENKTNLWRNTTVNTTNDNNNNNKYFKLRIIHFQIIILTVLTILAQKPCCSNAATIRGNDVQSSPRRVVERVLFNKAALDLDNEDIDSDELADDLYDIDVLQDALRHEVYLRHATLLRKRHSNSQPIWLNACNGEQTAKQGSGSTRKLQRFYLHHLKKEIHNQYLEMKHNKVINITDVKTLRKFKKEEAFLPHFKNINNSLLEWHKKMQIFVAVFAKLVKDAHDTNEKKEISDELHNLLLNAGRTLCEIETAINFSYPSINRSDIFTFISDEQMLAELQDLNKLGFSWNNMDKKDIDRKFAKYYYKNFLKHMLKVLRQVRRNHSSASSVAAENSLSNSRSFAVEENISINTLMKV